MVAGFETYIQANSSLSDKDVAYVRSLATHRTVRKNELLLQEGQVCRHKIFIIKGLLRTYGIGADGSEHILLFSPENTWTLDAESYDRQMPTQYNIDTIEPSEILLWNRNDFNRLLADIPQLKLFSEQLISRNIHSSRQRLLATLSKTPEEKYEDFVSTQPQLLSRLPLRMIASYLGMSLKTLTRIRHAQSQR